MGSAAHPSTAEANATFPFSGEKEKLSCSAASASSSSSAPPPPAASPSSPPAMKASASDRNCSEAKVLITRFTWAAVSEPGAARTTGGGTSARTLFRRSYASSGVRRSSTMSLRGGPAQPAEQAWAEEGARLSSLLITSTGLTFSSHACRSTACVCVHTLPARVSPAARTKCARSRALRRRPPTRARRRSGAPRWTPRCKSPRGRASR